MPQNKEKSTKLVEKNMYSGTIINGTAIFYAIIKKWWKKSCKIQFFSFVHVLELKTMKKIKVYQWESCFLFKQLTTLEEIMVSEAE